MINHSVGGEEPVTWFSRVSWLGRSRPLTSTDCPDSSSSASLVSSIWTWSSTIQRSGSGCQRCRCAWHTIFVWIRAYTTLDVDSGSWLLRLSTACLSVPPKPPNIEGVPTLGALLLSLRWTSFDLLGRHEMGTYRRLLFHYHLPMLISIKYIITPSNFHQLYNWYPQLPSNSEVLSTNWHCLTII